MAENTNSMDYGNVNISDDVIAGIVSISVEDMEGIQGLSSNLTQNIGDIFGIKTQSKGIKIEIMETGVKVDIGIIMVYGYKIPEICLKLQETVKSSVEAMTGLDVIAVDVHVNGIYLASQKPSEELE